MIMENDAFFSDLWKDAEMWKVVRYLRGGVGLSLPAEWREYLPPGNGSLKEAPAYQRARVN